MSKSAADKVERIYKSKSESERTGVYDEWAADYTNDLRALGYRIPGIVASLFARHLPADAAPILDAGAGTGLLGEALAVIGYKGITGIDLSEKMLHAAMDTGYYEAVRVMRLGDPLDFADDHFAATGSIGTFTEGHAGPEGFDELIRITRPGGKIILSIRVDDGVGTPYTDRIAELAADGKWRHAEVTGEFVSMPVGEAHVRHRVFVLDVR